MLDSSLSDIAVIVSTCLACGSIDYHLYLAVCDLVSDIGTSLVDLEDLLAGDTCFLDHLIALACCDDLESKLMEGLGDVNKLGLVSVAYAEENCSLERKLVRELRLLNASRVRGEDLPPGTY